MSIARALARVASPHRALSDALTVSHSTDDVIARPSPAIYNPSMDSENPVYYRDYLLRTGNNISVLPADLVEHALIAPSLATMRADRVGAFDEFGSITMLFDPNDIAALQRAGQATGYTADVWTPRLDHIERALVTGAIDAQRTLRPDEVTTILAEYFRKNPTRLGELNGGMPGLSRGHLTAMLAPERNIYNDTEALRRAHVAGRVKSRRPFSDSEYYSPDRYPTALLRQMREGLDNFLSPEQLTEVIARGLDGQENVLGDILSAPQVQRYLEEQRHLPTTYGEIKVKTVLPLDKVQAIIGPELTREERYMLLSRLGKDVPIVEELEDLPRDVLSRVLFGSGAALLAAGVSQQEMDYLYSLVEDV